MHLLDSQARLETFEKTLDEQIVLEQAPAATPLELAQHALINQRVSKFHAIGIHQLARVGESWLRRRTLWDGYQQALAGLPLSLPPEPSEQSRHAYHLYTVQVRPLEAALGRDGLLDAMTARGIGVGVHYLSIAEHPYYQQRLGWVPEQWPCAMKLGRQTLSLPLMPQLTSQDQARVVSALTDVLAR